MSSPGSTHSASKDARRLAKVRGSPSSSVAAARAGSSAQGLGLLHVPSGEGLSRSDYVASAEDLLPDQAVDDHDDGDRNDDDDEEALSDGDASDPEEQQADPPRPDFHPLFTVIQDATTGANAPHHPHVQYVFSDDDPEVVTSALLRTLDAADVADGQRSDVQERHERIVLVDLAADGKTVVNAQSLSPDWQVTATSVQAAPTFDDANAPDEAALMLTITGTEGFVLPTTGQNQQAVLDNAEAQAESDVFAALEAIAEQYNQEMASLKKWALPGGDATT